MSLETDDDSFQADRPRVIVSVTASADGRVALNRTSRLLDDRAGSVWRSLHPAGAHDVLAMRRAQIERDHQPQVILEGSGTFVADDAGPLADLPPVDDTTDPGRYDDFLPTDADCRWFAVVDGRGRIHWTHKGDADTRLLVVACEATPADYLSYLRRENIPYLIAGAERVALTKALHKMRERLGVTCVVSEAGGGLNGALLRAGLVDELHLVLLPAIIGGLATPATFDGPPLAAEELPTPLRLLDSHISADGTVWLHYKVDRS